MVNSPRAFAVALGPYSTQQIEYFFYFPSAGEAPHYPAQISRDGVLLASAEPRVLDRGVGTQELRQGIVGIRFDLGHG